VGVNSVATANITSSPLVLLRPAGSLYYKLGSCGHHSTGGGGGGGGGAPSYSTALLMSGRNEQNLATRQSLLFCVTKPYAHCSTKLWYNFSLVSDDHYFTSISKYLPF